MVFEGRGTTGTASNSRESPKLNEYFYMVDYLDECIDVPVKGVPSKTLKADVKMQNRVLGAAGNLIWIYRECP